MAECVVGLWSDRAGLNTALAKPPINRLDGSHLETGWCIHMLIKQLSTHFIFITFIKSVYFQLKGDLTSLLRKMVWWFLKGEGREENRRGEARGQERKNELRNERVGSRDTSTWR